MLERLVNSSIPAQSSYSNHRNLTERQIEVLKTAANLDYRGAVNSHVREALNIKEDTVKAHLRGIYDALGVTDIFSAVCIALNNQILPLEEVRGNNLPYLEEMLNGQAKRSVTKFHKEILNMLYNNALRTGEADYITLASDRSVTYQTTKNEIHKIYIKLGISNKAQLAVVAHIYSQMTQKPDKTKSI